MDDLIKRSDAIKAVTDLIVEDESRHLNDLEYGFNQGVSHAVSVLEDLPSADVQQEWIPTCDRLPSDSDYYLVTLIDAFGDTEICIAWYAHEKDYSGETGWREITDSDFVTAWMPLPKPWKGVDDE